MDFLALKAVSSMVVFDAFDTHSDFTVIAPQAYIISFVFVTFWCLCMFCLHQDFFPMINEPARL